MQLLKSFTRLIFKLLYRLEIKGLENYPLDAKRLVIVSNHVSFLDGIILWAVLPHSLTFSVSLLMIQKWWVKWIKLFVPVFSINPGKPIEIKSLIEYVKFNHHCVIFPEGRITTMGGLMKIYEGPGLVADRADAAILPVHIEGAQFSFFSLLRKKQTLHLFPKIQVTVFPPHHLTVSWELKGKERRKILSHQLYELLCEAAFFSQNTSLTLFESLLESKKRFGRKKIILESIHPTHQTLTYQQLIIHSIIFSNALQKHISFGDKVGILLPSFNAFLITFFALQLRNCVPTLLNFSISGRQLVKCCQTTRLKIVLTSRQFVEYAKLKDKVTDIETAGIKILYLEDFSKKITIFSKIMGFIQSFSHSSFLPPKINTPDAIAVIFFTSGSEGEPKGVALSHQNLQSNRFQLLTRINITSHDIVFNALPLFHTFSLNAGLLTPLFEGVRIFLYPTPLHFKRIPELCYDVNATILFSTDTFLSNYGRSANPYDFYSLKYVFAGAEKLKTSTYELWLNKFGLRIFEGYGTTETSPILAVNNTAYNKPNTVGKLLPAIDYQLKPIENIAYGGELYVKGPNVMLGYFTAGKLYKTGEWYRTGDVVSFDSEGFLTICDRLKRFAKVGGEMISLSQIEMAVTKLWPNYYHAALAKPDPEKGEQILLITTCPFASRKAIIDEAKNLDLLPLCIPKIIKIIDKIPLLPTGKIDLRNLIERYVV